MAIDPGEDVFSKLYPEASAREPNKEDPSHWHISLLDDGEPAAARFVYVDEHTCIGCTHCTHVAKCTFFLEDDFGRARVFNQEGDSDDAVMEAIDTCPVNCIHFVSHEDLVTLENERSGQMIDNKGRLMHGQEFVQTSFSKATAFDTGGTRCTNCPSRGCNACPMFGVGENPVYLERKAKREEMKQKTGDTAREAEQRRRAALIDELFGGKGLKSGAAADGMAGGADAMVDAIYADEWAVPDLDDSQSAGDAEESGDGALAARSVARWPWQKRAPADEGGKAGKLGRSGRQPAPGGLEPKGSQSAGSSDLGPRATAEERTARERAARAAGTAGEPAGGGAQQPRVVINVAAEAAYKELGLKKGATRAEVKKAYYKQARLFHPDTVGGDIRRNPTAAKNCGG